MSWITLPKCHLNNRKKWTVLKMIRNMFVISQTNKSKLWLHICNNEITQLKCCCCCILSMFIWFTSADRKKANANANAKKDKLHSNSIDRIIFVQIYKMLCFVFYSHCANKWNQWTMFVNPLPVFWCVPSIRPIPFWFIFIQFECLMYNMLKWICRDGSISKAKVAAVAKQQTRETASNPARQRW